MTTARFLTSAILLVVLVTMGCGGGRRRTGPGPGPVGPDMGMVTMFDAGTTDSGPPVIVVDLGTRDLGTRDLGTRDLGRDLGSSCTPTRAVYVAGAYCSSTTATCASACADGACINACLDRDSSPDCSTCAQQNLIACANENGCVTQWNAISCCVQSNCPTGSSATCVDTFCTPESDSYAACANSVLPTAMCTNDFTSCFP